jgi:hydroxypyruvate reductase
MPESTLRAVATELQQAALDAVDPAAGIQRHVRREGDELIVAGHRYELDDYERVLVIGGGKAAVPMMAATAEILDERLDQGVLVTKYGHAEAVGSSPVFDPSTSNVDIIEAGHPVPDDNSVYGAEAVADLASRATAQDLVICLISGGGSALLTLPVPSLTLSNLQELTDALLRSGATIDELNTVRKHCSRIKGGNLAQLAAPADVITLILSDVVGDPLDVIASGPTVPDPTTVTAAREVLERYGIGRDNEDFSFLQETPKPGDTVFEHVRHVLIGSNRQAARAAVTKARQLGFDALLLSTYVEGEAREVARVAAGLAKGMHRYGDPLSPPACLVWGGETTVTVRGHGKGGRNQELALAAALALEGWPRVLVMALATDGTDGPTDAAGAVVTGDTIGRARELGLDPWAALESNDSYHFFEASGDLIRTGPTGTNVNDLLFILAGGP